MDLEILKKIRERRKFSPQKLLFGSDSQGFGIQAVETTNGKIIAIRVQDIQRQLWFSWDNGVWDNPPSCVPGAGNLYIAFYAENQGTVGSLTLTLSDAIRILSQKVTVVNQGMSDGLEWTGDMPVTTYNIVCEVTP